MEKGKVKYMGTYEELQHSDEIQHIIETIGKTAIEEEEKSNKNIEGIEEEKEEHLNESKINTTKNYLSEKGTYITEDENAETTEVPWSLYVEFFSRDKNWIAYLMIIPFFFGYSYFIVYSYIHYSRWVTHSEEKYRFWRDFLLALGHPLGFSLCIFIVILIIILSTLRKTKKLQEDMFKAQLNAPINLYFDKMPSGKILNRFSNDLNKLDNEFPR